MQKIKDVLAVAKNVALTVVAVSGQLAHVAIWLVQQNPAWSLGIFAVLLGLAIYF